MLYINEHNSLLIVNKFKGLHSVHSIIMALTSVVDKECEESDSCR